MIFHRQSTRALFNENFVKPGKVSVEKGRFYSRMYDFRQKNDYGDFVEFEQDKIREWLAQAEVFVDEIDQAIIKELEITG
ncbi:MAG: HEPN domain-containing protein [Syntrophales bacterium]|nr:HEPN domain-containing protein [Syntrophales bacterium]